MIGVCWLEGRPLLALGALPWLAWLTVLPLALGALPLPWLAVLPLPWLSCCIIWVRKLLPVPWLRV